MTGSLLVGPYDVLATGSSVRLTSDRDFGAPVTDTTTVERILLDGDTVAGVRSGNRELTLALYVNTGSRAGDAAVVGALYQVVNQQQWAITWTPDSGMPTVAFDCLRGALTQQWSEHYGVSDRLVTLTIPAAPFTRDATPAVLAPPAAPPVPVLLDGYSSTAGLSSTQAWPNALYTDQLSTQDALPAVTAVDSSTSASGGSSVRVAQPVTQFTLYAGAYEGSPIVMRFTPFTVARPLPAVTDLTVTPIVSWRCRVEQTGSGAVGIPTLHGLDPTKIGIVAADQDPAALSTSLSAGSSWTVRLVDSSGRAGYWVVQQSAGPSQTWAAVSVDTSVTPLSADAGFDLTHVASYRLRCYAINQQYPLRHGTTSPELYTTAGQVTAPANLLNCTSPSTDYYQGSTTGTFEVSTPAAVPVTAGSVYSGACTAQLYPDGLTFQCGIAWLNSSKTVLSTSWGTAVGASSNTNPAEDPYLRSANPTVAGVTAPAGAVFGQIRWRVLGATATNFTVHGLFPHLLPGATAWRWPYPNGGGAYGTGEPEPFAYMWFDQLQAASENTGVVLTSPYELAPFPNIEGAARTPISALVKTTTGSASFVLLARTPNPPAQFNPFLTVFNTGSDADPDALSGSSKGLVDPTSFTQLTATVPAGAYNSTYTLLARMKTTDGSTVSRAITTTAGLTGDTTNTVADNSAVLSIGGAYQWFTLGSLPLPPRSVDPANTAQTMDIVFTQTGSTVLLVDLVVLVDQAGEMVTVDLTPNGGKIIPGGSAASRFFFDSPDSLSFTGTVYAGTNDQRTDAVSCAPFQDGQAVINFDPGYNTLTVVLDQVTAGSVQLTYSPRWIAERPS